MEAPKSNVMAEKESAEHAEALEQLKRKKEASTMGRMLLKSGLTKLKGKTE